jgi:hypothetical protein
MENKPLEKPETEREGLTASASSGCYPSVSDCLRVIVKASGHPADVVFRAIIAQMEEENVNQEELIHELYDTAKTLVDNARTQRPRAASGSLE